MVFIKHLFLSISLKIVSEKIILDSKKIIYFLLFIILFSYCGHSECFNFENGKDRSWIDCTSFPWVIDPSSGHESGYSLKSGLIMPSGFSSICRKITGPANISFWWMADNYKFLDYGFHGGQEKIRVGTYRFLIDGIRQDEYEFKDKTWEKKGNYSIGEGSHILEWIFIENTTYLKDGTGYFAGYLDDLCIEIKDKKPSITLIEPDDNKSIFINLEHAHTIVKFKYMSWDDRGVTKTLFYIYKDSKIFAQNDTPIKDKNFDYYEYEFTQPANYSWRIEVIDTIGQRNESANRTLKIIQDEPPLVNLTSPMNMSLLYINTSMDYSPNIFENKKVRFEYTPKDDNCVKKCILYVYQNSKLYNISNNSFISNNVKNNFSIEFNQPGNYSYKIACFDSLNQMNESKTYSFVIHAIMIVKSGTNLAQAINRSELENISMLKLEIGNHTLHGKYFDLHSLNLIGASQNNTIIQGDKDNSNKIYIRLNNCKIQNITLDISLNISGNDTYFESNRFISKNGSGIEVQHFDNITIIDNIFDDVSNERNVGFSVFIDNSNEINLKNNRFIGNDEKILIMNSINVTLKYDNIPSNMPKCACCNCTKNCLIDKNCVRVLRCT